MNSQIAKKLGMAVVLVAVGCMLGFVASPLLTKGEAMAQKKKPKKSPYNEISIGTVPTEYGDLISVSGTRSNSLLAFKNEKGEVRLLEFRGNKITPSCFRVDRNY